MVCMHACMRIPPTLVFSPVCPSLAKTRNSGRVLGNPSVPPHRTLRAPAKPHPTLSHEFEDTTREPAGQTVLPASPALDSRGLLHLHLDPVLDLDLPPAPTLLFRQAVSNMSYPPMVSPPLFKTPSSTPVPRSPRRPSCLVNAHEPYARRLARVRRPGNGG